MTLEQLKIFVEAAQYGSFTVAAENLGLTQSAVSVSIKKIEEKYNVSLFDRGGRRLLLTEAGQKLLNRGRAHLAGRRVTIPPGGEPSRRRGSIPDRRLLRERLRQLGAWYRRPTSR